MTLAKLPIAAAAAAFAALAPSVVQAQGRWPERPIRLIIPFAPGGQTDILGRRYAQKLTPLIGQNVVPDNRGGGGGTIGTTEAARARPDGHTLVVGTSSTHAINPTAMDNPPYDPIRDFSAIALLGIIPLSITVHPSLPAKTLKALVADVRAKPGRYSFGSSGMGGINHLAGELFKKQAGNLDIQHIPYKGSGQANQDLLGGQIPITTATFSSVIGYHRAGRLRILAVTHERRSRAAPDIPTAIEGGVPDMVAYTFNLVAGPAGMPRAVVDPLHQATAKIMADEAFQRELEGIGVDPVADSDPDRTVRFVRTELARWAPIIKATGTKVE